MLRITKLTDYAVVLLTHFGSEPDRIVTARELAERAALPLPTVGKILKSLCRADVLVSHRGINGGYSLSRAPNQISIVDIIGAVEGPVALTECSAGGTSNNCELERSCPVRGNWARLTSVLRGALEKVSLEDMSGKPHDPRFEGKLVELFRGEA